MDNSILIEAVSCCCGKCSKPLRQLERIVGSYVCKHLTEMAVDPYKGADVGIIPAVRPIWIHVDCSNTQLTGWHLNPSIRHCIKCGLAVSKEDVLVPVFRVENERAVNPSDPTDVGIALGERLYFVHADCTNPRLSSINTNLLYKQ